MSNVNQVTDAILSLQPDGQLWRFSVSGNTTNKSTFEANVRWEDGTAKCAWSDVQPKMAAALTALEAVATQHSRRLAYREESDQLFFQEEAGEVSAGTWAAKRAEIKSRFPK